MGNQFKPAKTSKPSQAGSRCLFFFRRVQQKNKQGNYFICAFSINQTCLWCPLQKFLCSHCHMLLFLHRYLTLSFITVLQSVKRRACNHAHCGSCGLVAVHDTTRVSGGQWRVSEKEPGSSWTDHAVWTHGHKLQTRVHFTRRLLLPLGAYGALHQRLQYSAGRNRPVGMLSK